MRFRGISSHGRYLERLLEMADDSDLVLVERRDAIAVVTLNEPQRMNPLGDQMRHALIAIMENEMASPDVHAIVLTGAGGQFSAGADVRQMRTDQGPDPARSRRRLEPLHRIVRLVAGGPKPVVVAVEGVAFGAGLSIAAASDFLVCGASARFGAAFGKIGLTADCGLLWSLPQRIGLARAKNMMFTGQPLLADQAFDFGLADRKVEAGKALESAIDKAREYLDTAPLSIAAIKSGLALGPADLENALQIEREQQPMLSMTLDHDEGRKAFLEKRKPVFIGR